VTSRARLGDVKNTNGPVFVRNRVVGIGSNSCAGRESLTDRRQENAGAAKLVMNVLKENELIFCVQKNADY
jgi:hypothetical protein